MASVVVASEHSRALTWKKSRWTRSHAREYRDLLGTICSRRTGNVPNVVFKHHRRIGGKFGKTTENVIFFLQVLRVHFESDSARARSILCFLRHNCSFTNETITD